MKKVLSILLVLVLCASVMTLTALAANGSMSATGATMEAGGTAAVSVSLTSNPGVMSYTVNANVPSGFSISWEGTGMGGGVWTCGKKNAVWDNASDSTYTGKVLDVTVTADASVAPGTYTITFSSNDGSNYNEDDVIFGSCTATITVVCNHTPGTAVKENNVDATCGKDGGYDMVTYCTKCGEKTGSTHTTVPATGNHTAGAAVKENVVAETCGKEGSYNSVVYCSVCNTKLSSEKITVPATGNHTAGEAKKENVVAATCTEDGSYEEVVYCTKCDAEMTRTTKTVKAPGHTAGEAKKENVVPHTCTEDGSYEEVVYCSVCNEELSRVEKVDPKGHTHAAAVRENEVKGDCKTKHSYDSVVYCSVCQAEVSRTKVVGELGGHTYGTDGKCSCCGKVKDPDLDDQPDTGDIFVEMAMYASLAALAVGAVVFARRKARG